VIEMAQWGNPEVRAWMKSHKEEVAKIRRRYDELKELGLDDLLIMAVEKGADVSKVGEMLISKIIAVEGEK